MAAIAVVAIVAIGIGLALGGQDGSPVASASGSPLASAATSPSASPSPQVTASPASPSASVEPSATAPLEPDTPPGEIVFVAGRDDIDLSIVNADGSGEVRRLTSTPGTVGDPAFSPDGSQVAYSTRAGLRIVDVESGDSREFTDVASDRNAFWSPVADVMLFSRGMGQDREIFRMDLDGGDAIQLTDNQIEDHDPVVSPDGSTIVWVVGEGDQRELWMMDLDGNVIDELTDDDINDVDPVYSPTGDRIVFASRRGPDGERQDHFDLWILDLATRDLTQLTDMDGDEHDPWWSPGGRYVAFQGGSRDELPAAERSEQIHIVDTTDGDVVTVVQTPDRQRTPTWRP